MQDAGNRRIEAQPLERLYICAPADALLQLEPALVEEIMTTIRYGAALRFYGRI